MYNIWRGFSGSYLQCIEPVPDALVSPEQNPAVLVVGEGDGEVALPRQQRHLLHLRESELNKHHVDGHSTHTPLRLI